VEALEHIRRQLGALEDLGSLVRSMKALAASSIHQYERAVHSLTGYYRTVELGLHIVLRDMPQAAVEAPPAGGRFAAILFGSDYGLCGRFNEDLIEHALDQMQALAPPPRERLLLAVGARPVALLERAGQSVEQQLLVPSAASAVTGTVRRILLLLEDWRAHRGVGHVHLFYNRHLSTRRYQPLGLQLLPVTTHRFHSLTEEPWPSHVLPMFTLPREGLLLALLQQYFFVTLFRACAESLASENGSRLAAMQMAEKNMEERHVEALGEFRRRRQEAITGELLDLLSGFEAAAER
jgi:F-type H+-transporting ATPase subunit gamma